MAAASRARGMLWLALIMAAEWAAILSVWLAEQATGEALNFINPVIDAIVAAILLRIAMRPDFPGRAIYQWIVALLLLQALTRLGLTVYLPDAVRFVLNRMFEAIWLSIMVYSGLRIRRRRTPAAKPQEDRQPSLFAVWAEWAIYRLFVAVHNDERPEAEQITPEPARNSQSAAGKGVSKTS